VGGYPSLGSGPHLNQEGQRRNVAKIAIKSRPRTPPTTPPTIGPTSGPAWALTGEVVATVALAVEEDGGEDEELVVSMLCEPMTLASVTLKVSSVHVDGSLAAYSGMAVPGGTGTCGGNLAQNSQI